MSFVVRIWHWRPLKVGTSGSPNASSHCWIAGDFKWARRFVLSRIAVYGLIAPAVAMWKTSLGHLHKPGLGGFAEPTN